MATTFAPACKQTGRLYGPGAHNRYDATIGSTLGQALGEEDALYLNIWQPAADPGRPRPVVVWVHGGSNLSGYTADPVYDGATLARSADLVVVSVAYRLGIFGFLDLPALKTGERAEDSGNFALLDIVKALEFVQANIAAFGGNPDCVTLMGHSAGAVNVCALLTSPMLRQRPRPLFHRVVSLSGGISSAASLPPGAIPAVLPRQVLAQRGDALLCSALVADGTAEDADAARAWVATRDARTVAEHLRAWPADGLLERVRNDLGPRGLGAANLVADGWVVAADPIAAVRAGDYRPVPVLAGITRDECRLFPAFLALRPDLGGTSGRRIDDAEVFAIAHRHDPEAPPSTTVEHWIPAPYLPVDAADSGFKARTDRLNACWFVALRDDLLDALRSRQPDVWCYAFAWDRLPAPFDQLYGAAHGFDLPFLFGNFGPSLHANICFTRTNARGRLALSEAMMSALGAFAAAGDPNHAMLGVSWPRWPGRCTLDASDDGLHITT